MALAGMKTIFFLVVERDPTLYRKKGLAPEAYG
jgi:hypothetical protein